MSNRIKIIIIGIFTTICRGLGQMLITLGKQTVLQPSTE